ncbi:hypothetical protein CN311_23480 [Mesorhizobium sanjuanii]|uniref:Cytochrome C n=1 Tax=Mesorhizobium sanjuanii TaxID=2037900 RepID=A0A2A6FAJ6_9HYPH|nr:hypothetical protein [Mesorhizobium sanjuanii]PDQ18671.1 hypothetical protein CN311_23480 [Mesorhizobium sanjuanii]
MNIKAICLGAAIALSASGGIALAGTLDDPDTMKPFFTDASMKTMKPLEEFKHVFMAMPAEKQEAMKNECKGMEQPYTAFCANVNTLGGHN